VAKQQHGLGRGLGALIPDTIPGIQEIGTGQNVSITIPIGKIRANPKQPRKEFSQESLDELADSIRQHGVIQPILIEETAPDGYMIVAGERRWRAAQIAGLREIPVLIKSFTDQQRLEISLIENIQREDLNPVEEAHAYRNLMEITGLAQEEVARRVGKNRSTVANALRLLKLPDEMLIALRDGSLTAGHARAVLAVVNPADQSVLFNRVRADGLSVRQAEEMSKQLNSGLRAKASGGAKPDHSAPALRPELREIQQRLIDALGTKVTVSGDGKKGRVIVEYYSPDDLDRLLGIVAK
jgi:ParB family chromosome partitioning protein